MKSVVRLWHAWWRRTGTGVWWGNLMEIVMREGHQYDIFVNCNWVATRWQLYSTHLHTNNSQNDIKQTIHRTTHKFWKRICSSRIEQNCKIYRCLFLEFNVKLFWSRRK